MLECTAISPLTWCNSKGLSSSLTYFLIAKSIPVETCCARNTVEALPAPNVPKMRKSSSDQRILCSLRIVCSCRLSCNARCSPALSFRNAESRARRPGCCADADEWPCTSSLFLKASAGATAFCELAAVLLSFASRSPSLSPSPRGVSAYRRIDAAVIVRGIKIASRRRAASGGRRRRASENVPCGYGYVLSTVSWRVRSESRAQDIHHTCTSSYEGMVWCKKRRVFFIFSTLASTCSD